MTAPRAISAAATPPDMERHARLIAAMIGRPTPFVPEAEDAQAVHVERGVAFPAALQDPLTSIDPYFNRLEENPPHGARVVDRRGHQRPMHAGLLVYCWVQALRVMGRSLEPAHRWCDHLASELNPRDDDVDSIPAARGAETAARAWAGLALWSAGKPWDGRADASFADLCQRQQRDGGFLRAGASDNPETRWYHELVLLHAVASYAMQAGNAQARAAARRNAAFHLNETQPDHATGQPWGLSGFLLDPSTHMLADQLLHTAQTLSPQGPDGVSLMLLADCLYCIRKVSGSDR